MKNVTNKRKLSIYSKHKELSKIIYKELQMMEKNNIKILKKLTKTELRKLK